MIPILRRILRSMRYTTSQPIVPPLELQQVPTEIKMFFEARESRLRRDRDAFFKEKVAMKLSLYRLIFTVCAAGGALVTFLCARRDLLKETANEQRRRVLEFLCSNVIPDQDECVRTVSQLLTTKQCLLYNVPYVGGNPDCIVSNKAWGKDGSVIANTKFHWDGVCVRVDTFDISLALSPVESGYPNNLRALFKKDTNEPSFAQSPQLHFIEREFRKIVSLFARLEQRAQLIEKTERCSFSADVIFLADAICANGDLNVLLKGNRAKVAAVQAYFRNLRGVEGDYARGFLRRVCGNDCLSTHWTIAELEDVINQSDGYGRRHLEHHNRDKKETIV